MAETVNQDRPPNFRDECGDLYLVRCYACAPEHGTENWAPAVAGGTCAWCGWGVAPEDLEHLSASPSPPKTNPSSSTEWTKKRMTPPYIEPEESDV